MVKTLEISIPKLSEKEKERLDLANKFNARKNGTRRSRLAAMLKPAGPKIKQVGLR